MTRTLFIFVGLFALASCAQYQEPKANCFSFLAAVAPIEPDCAFAPVYGPEGDVEV